MKIILAIILAFKSVNSFGFSTDFPPGEGVPTFIAKSSKLTLKKQPNKKSEVLQTINVNIKKSIESAATYIQIQNPPVMTYSSLKTFEATCYGKVKHLSKDDYYSKGNSKKIEVGPRTKASYFQYRAEGTHLVEIDGEVCAVEESNLGKKSSTEKIEWWIQMEPNKKDVQSGWLLVGEDIIEVKRKF